MAVASKFDPSRHLTKVSGADYMEVRWRLVWLRETHADAVIATELVSHNDSFALFRAMVSVPGGGSATGWGSETVDDFRDFIEKAETKALGRALAALGFGTQFCPEFDFAASGGQVVDSPIDFASSQGRQLANDRSRGQGQRLAVVDPPASQRQTNFLRSLAIGIGLPDDLLAAEIDARFGSTLGTISRYDASELIEELQRRRPEAKLAS
ncbi:MAG: hypothetical protein WKF63_03940 [Thermomicrobiales bacterium]